MTFKAVIMLIVGGILVNNYAIEKLFGIVPFIGASDKLGKSCRMGHAVAIVSILSAIANWAVSTFVLAPLGLSYMQTLIFTLVIILVTFLCGLIAKSLKASFGVYFPLVAVNSAALALSVNTASLPFAETAFTAIGVGLGFLVGIVLFAGVQSRIDNMYVPKAFRGLPVSLLAAGIMSMLFIAFK